MKKKLVAIALAGTILATSIVTPFTAQADEILTKIQQQETKITELDSKQNTAAENLSAITAEVDAAEKRAETLLANRVKTQDEIVALQEDIAELQVVIAQREEQLDEQARSVQVNGSNENYLNFIVASESFTDLVSRIDVVSKMVSANKELVEQQVADQKAVEDKKNKTEDNLNEINAMAMELEQLKGDLQVKRIEQESAVAALAAEKATAESDREMFLAQKEEADQRAAAEAASIAAAEAAAATVAATVAQASSEESSTAASSVDIASSTVASSESAAPAQTVAAAPVVESAPVVSAPEQRTSRQRTSCGCASRNCTGIISTNRRCCFHCCDNTSAFLMYGAEKHHQALTAQASRLMSSEKHTASKSVATQFLKKTQVHRLLYQPHKREI